MRKESLYQFILYTLLMEEKSNLLFMIAGLIVGKWIASIHYFSRLYAGCDIPSFLHLKDLFEKEHPNMLLGVTIEDIEKDEHGVMTGKMKLR